MYQYNCQLIKVIDGDTISVLVDLGFKTFVKVSLRLARIDAPEIKTTEGKLAKEELSNLFDRYPGFNLQFTSLRLDRYGRSVAEVYLVPPKSTEYNKIDLSEWLVSKQLAIYKHY